MTGAATSSRVPVLCTWGISTFSGWGVYGLNLAFHWAQDPDLRPIFVQVLLDSHFQVDPLRQAKLAGVIKESREIARALDPKAKTGIGLDGVAIDALGNAFVGSKTSSRIRARSTLGAIFFEDTYLDEQARTRASRFELIIAGSTWNAQVLRSAGVGPVCSVLQGVDPTLFHPAATSGLFGGRFLIFSGGKLEPRKAQDLVLIAFKRFAERHPEAMLVTAWHSPWPKLAAPTGRERHLAPVTFNEKGNIEVVRWAVENGLKQDQIMDIGPTPNALMPQVLREMSAALFMNRCEGGTNLVAMECMACGVPTILSANTGHLDLLRDGTAIALRRQGQPSRPVGTRGIEGWGESDVEEAVEALERVYSDRALAAETGKRGAALLATMSWARQTALLKEAISPFLKRGAS